MHRQVVMREFRRSTTFEELATPPSDAAPVSPAPVKPLVKILPRVLPLPVNTPAATFLTPKRRRGRPCKVEGQPRLVYKPRTGKSSKSSSLSSLASNISSTSVSPASSISSSSSSSTLNSSGYMGYQNLRDASNDSYERYFNTDEALGNIYPDPYSAFTSPSYPTTYSPNIATHTQAFDGVSDLRNNVRLRYTANSEYDFQNNGATSTSVNDTAANVFQNNQTMTGYQNNQTMTGYQNNQTMTGYQNNQMMTGYQNNQMMTGYQNNQMMTGYQNNQMMAGYQNNEMMAGYRNNDMMTGHRNNEMMTGHQINEMTTRYQNNEMTTRYQNNEMTTGYQKNEMMTGYRNNDMMTGHRNNEMMTGHRNNEMMTGYQNNKMTTGYQNNDMTTGYQNNGVFNGITAGILENRDISSRSCENVFGAGCSSSKNNVTPCNDGFKSLTPLAPKSHDYIPDPSMTSADDEDVPLSEVAKDLRSQDDDLQSTVLRHLHAHTPPP